VKTSVKRVQTLLIVTFLSALTACDPGYEFTIHNPCDAPIRVDLRDSDEFDRVGISPVTLEPYSTNTWSKIDPDIKPPFGALLLSGPREGDLIKSETPDVTIPESGCEKCRVKERQNQHSKASYQRNREKRLAWQREYNARRRAGARGA
jgi:hypothetical protein